MAEHPPNVALLVEQIDTLWRQSPEVGRRWLIAVSGGPDSMALLRGAHILRSQTDIEIACGHVDHQLRPDSTEDANWVQQECETLATSCFVERAALSGEEGEPTAIEERARQERYRLLAGMAKHWGATAILTAHTADDNAETILHHLLRGTGLRGLVGIPQQRSLKDGPRLWRPLLGVRRSIILSALRELNQESLTDSTNASGLFTRNRIRRELIPWVEKEVNPRAVDALLRLSDQAWEQQSWIEQEAEKLLDRALVESSMPTVRLRRRELEGAPQVLLRECFVRLWVRQHWPRQAMTAEHWQRLSDFCRSREPRAIQMPGGFDVRHRGEIIVIESSSRPA